MLDLRRIPVVTEYGYKFVLVVNGTFLDAMENGTVSEKVPEGSIVAIEECDQDLESYSYYSFNPEEKKMSFSVSTPENCICKMPDAVKDVEDLKLGETQGQPVASAALLDQCKKAAIAILESGDIGDDTCGFRVTVSGHTNEPPAMGDSLSVSISATAPTEPPARSE